jgi:protein-S-isoprenylcysteine O-methyltransferase Ste14
MITDFVMNYLETTLVCILFLFYLVIWKVKRMVQIKETGNDPEVLRATKSPLQSYIYKIFLFLTFYAILLILAHTFKLSFYSFFTVWEITDEPYIDLFGFIWGACGLIICFIAQKQMGDSWRVGIDEETKTKLITSGIFRLARNPTYTGLLILFSSLWLIWSSWSVSLFFIIFFIVIEVQVRCEEEHLLNLHHNDYGEYLKKSYRYLPFIY